MIFSPLPTLFLRRLILPVVGVVAASCAVVAVALLLRMAQFTDPQAEGFAGEVLVVCVVGGIVLLVAAVSIWVLAHAYLRRQAREIVELFLTVSHSRDLRAHLPPGAGSLEDPARVLDAIADSFAQVIRQATKDKAQLEAVLASMNDGIIALDFQQKILLVNDAAREMLGVVNRAEVANPVWEVVKIDSILAAVSEVLLTGRAKTFEIALDARTFEITVLRVPIERQAGVIVVAHDVTEAARYHDLRREFVANVSHELRTPLTMIKGFVETLRDGAIEDKQLAMQYLATVQRHSDQLTNLVSDLLELSRFDSGSYVAGNSPVHLEKVAEHVVEMMQPAALKKQQTLTVQADAEVSPVLGDPDHLQRAIANLVENAIKYTKEGGAIAVSVRNGRQIEVSVKDNGIGMSKDDLPRIFERFYRVDRSRSREMGGTGLGLSIVKHIVQSHGGSVDVESEMGKGSTFMLRFPAAK